MAIGVLRYLVEAGADVPGQVSVVSFDGTPLADFTHRSLSTVVAPMSEVGRQAFETLLDAMKGEIHRAAQHVLPVELPLRESLGPAPAA